MILGLALIAELTGTAAFPTHVHAASTITVTTIDDNTTADTFCSLREAITNADADVHAD
jgi:CSLREA domain-containing protein